MLTGFGCSFFKLFVNNATYFDFFGQIHSREFSANYKTLQKLNRQT